MEGGVIVSIHDTEMRAQMIKQCVCVQKVGGERGG